MVSTQHKGYWELTAAEHTLSRTLQSGVHPPPGMGEGRWVGDSARFYSLQHCSEHCKQETPLFLCDTAAQS